MSRAAIAILSTQNLLHNLKRIKQSAPNKKVMAMVKANAFGHGLRSTALRLEKQVDNFGVASIDEALALRKVGITIPITLMEGVFEPNELLIAACQQFDVVFHAFEQIYWLNNTPLPLPLKAWIKVDTGMNRLGLFPNEVPSALEQLRQSKNIDPDIGLMSHFACADEPQHSLNQKQSAVFFSLAKTWNGPKSLANSAAIFSFPESHCDVIRPGIALYGVSPFKNKPPSDLKLKPVMTLQTRLTAIKTCPAGSSIGYGASYLCKTDKRIGIIAIGYGDGYLRSLHSGTPVLVNNIKCKVLGRIAMDMAAIDLTPCPQAKISDSVILWGEGLPIETIIENTPLLAYELLTAVQSRVKFHWTAA